jgi:hypothetical protein
MSAKTQTPPEAPQLGRNLRFYPAHLIGVLLMLAVPILALLGMLGDARAETNDTGSTLEIRVEYQLRMRYTEWASTEIVLNNLSDEPFETLTVRIDKAYLDGFDEITLSPDATRITDAYYEVEVENIQPGETRIVTAAMRGERYGQHEGRITASFDTSETVEVTIGTFVFP